MKAVILLCLVSVALGMPDRTPLRNTIIAEALSRFPLTDNQSGRIVGGTNATRGAYPWQVSVQTQSWWDPLPIFYKHQCGGVIIARDLVVTAAQCATISGTMNIRINAGEHDLSVSELSEQRSVVSEVVHPDYDGETFENDIAILRLETPLTFTEYVKAIDLAPEDFVPSENDCVTTGWGKLRAGSSSYHYGILQEVMIPLVPSPVCAERYASVGNNITDDMLCAGSPGKGPCQFDAGGPLVCDNILVGISSFGAHPCTEGDLPTVFSRVSYHYSWLLSQFSA